MEKPKYSQSHTTMNMDSQEPSFTLAETIQKTLTLLRELEEKLDYKLINQLGWNLGWKDNIYYAEILEDNFSDAQAINLAIKVLEDILEAHPEETEEEQK